MGRPMPTKTLLTTGQVARLCEVSTGTVLRWIDSGLLPATRLPCSGFRRVTREAMEQFLLERNLAGDRGLHQKPWLSMDEAARLLRVCPRTVRNWFDRGKLSGTREPDAVRQGERRICRRSVLRIAESLGLRESVARLTPHVLLVGYSAEYAAAVAAGLPEYYHVDTALGIAAAALDWATRQQGTVVLDVALGTGAMRELAGVLAGQEPPPLILAVRPEDRPEGWLGVPHVVDLPAEGLTAAALAAAVARANGGGGE